MTRGTRVVVIADPLLGFAVIENFERDGRALIRFEAQDAAAEWEPPDELHPYHAQELEVADRWAAEVVPSVTDAELAELLNQER